MSDLLEPTEATTARTRDAEPTAPTDATAPTTTTPSRHIHVPRPHAPRPRGPRPPIDGIEGPEAPDASWPRAAKLLVAVLAVLALIAAAFAVSATRSADTEDEVADLELQVDTLVAEQAQLTADLESATARVATLTAQRDTLNDRIATLDAEMATTSADRDAIEAQRVSLLAERTALQTSLAAAEVEVADLEQQLGAATDLTATLDERIAMLDVQVGWLLDRAVAAEAERDALIELFPIRLDSSLQGLDVTGDWAIGWSEAYCQDFATCGSTPGFTELTISETPEGWLRVAVDGVLDAGLFRVEGALEAITASTTAAPACGTEQRVAHVGMTITASQVTVSDDGTQHIDDLALVYVVDAPATTTCPAGLAIYGGSLTAS